MPEFALSLQHWCQGSTLNFPQPLLSKFTLTVHSCVFYYWGDFTITFIVKFSRLVICKHSRSSDVCTQVPSAFRGCTYKTAMQTTGQAEQVDTCRCPTNTVVLCATSTFEPTTQSYTYVNGYQICVDNQPEISRYHQSWFGSLGISMETFDSSVLHAYLIAQW